MKGSPKVIDALNAGLTIELTAVNQYFCQAKMCQNWGLARLGAKHYEESMGEMKHAEKLIERIIFLEGVPEIARYDVIRVGADVKEQLENDLALEMKEVRAYNAAIRVCLDENDNGSRELFAGILVESEEHVDWLESQLDLIKTMGLPNYLVTQVGEGEGHKASAPMSYRDQNRAAWNRLAEIQSRFTKVATDEECREPLAALDGRGWLPASVRGLDVLCLASGGGWQSILYAAAGANVTVVDLSPEMLEIDEREALRRGLSVRTVEASMDDLSILRDESFDVVHQPVSTCYVPDVAAVYREIARVLRDGGLYISQHKQPTSLQISHRDAEDHYVIGVEYYRRGPLPRVADASYREPGAAEYLHRWDQLVGDLCRSGFVLEDLREPYRADEKAAPGHFGHRGRFVAPYVRLKARRVPRERGEVERRPVLWTP